MATCLLSSFLGFSQGWGYNWDIKAHDKGQFKFQMGVGVQRTENKYWFYKASQLFDNSDWPESGNDNNFEVYLNQLAFRLRSTGPYVARFEYGLNRTLSVSLGAAYTRYSATWNKGVSDNTTGTIQQVQYGVNVDDVGIVSRLNYHPIVTTHWDVYLSGGIGYNLWMINDFTANTKDTVYNSFFKEGAPVYFDCGMGARYYFRRRSAIYAEAGYGKSFMNVGFMLKMFQPRSNRSY